MFEVLTTIAFLQFDKYACDYVVLETGLGGRLDSTNIIRQPEVVVITALGYDHCERLGYTMAEIAHEKAGIFRTGVPVIALDPRHVFSVDAAEGASAYNQLLTEAAAKKADIFFVDPTCFRVNTADFAGQSYSFTNIPLGLEDYLSSRGAPMLGLRHCEHMFSARLYSGNIRSATRHCLCWPPLSHIPN